jgi:hypothetical protein
MEEVLEKLEAIEKKLSAIHHSIGMGASDTSKNFEILDKSLKQKIDEIKNEIIDEIKKGK